MRTSEVGTKVEEGRGGIPGTEASIGSGDGGT